MSNDNVYSREQLLRSFRAAAASGVGGAMILNGASTAGMLLSIYGSARAAFNAVVNSMPMAGAFPQAMRILDKLAEIERSDTLPPASAVEAVR